MRSWTSGLGRFSIEGSPPINRVPWMTCSSRVGSKVLQSQVTGSSYSGDAPVEVVTVAFNRLGARLLNSSTLAPRYPLRGVISSTVIPVPRIWRLIEVVISSFAGSVSSGISPLEKLTVPGICWSPFELASNLEPSQDTFASSSTVRPDA